MQKSSFPLIIDTILPLLLILYVIVVAFLPTLYAKPKHNFLYTNNYTYDYMVAVTNGKVTVTQAQNTFNTPSYKPSAPAISLYDITTDTSKSLSVEEAQAYTLNPSSESPDGYTVTRNDLQDNTIFPLFLFGGYNQGYYLTGHGLHRKIQGSNLYDLKFLGWVRQ